MSPAEMLGKFKDYIIVLATIIASYNTIQLCDTCHIASNKLWFLPPTWRAIGGTDMAISTSLIKHLSVSFSNSVKWQNWKYAWNLNNVTTWGKQKMCFTQYALQARYLMYCSTGSGNFDVARRPTHHFVRGRNRRSQKEKHAHQLNP